MSCLYRWWAILGLNQCPVDIDRMEMEMQLRTSLRRIGVVAALGGALVVGTAQGAFATTSYDYGRFPNDNSCEYTGHYGAVAHQWVSYYCWPWGNGQYELFIWK